MKKNKPMLYDPLIIARVKQYLEENVDKTFLDVGVMSKQLQDRYPEYNRRKFAPFHALVQQAYRIVSHSYGMESQPSSGNESDGSDLEMMEEPAPTGNNFLNNTMKTLYSKPKPNASSVAIDISSDEDEDDEGARANGKATKGFGQKRNEFPSMDQPLKKHKPENNDEKQQTHQKQNPQQLRQIQQQNQQKRIANYNQNSNDSSHFRSHLADIQQQQLRQRKYKKVVQLQKSRETFQDIGGMDKTLKELCELLMHIKTPDIYFVLGVLPPRGILLHGPPGCGKTLLARAIAGQINFPLIEIPATELIAGISGESEERIRDVFEQAALCTPCVLFIDEIDAISSNRSNAQKDMERRVVSQLIMSLDSLKSHDAGQYVLVIGATTRPDALDPALRRVGRFDHEIAIGIPSRKDRKEILAVVCDGVTLEPKCDFDKIAELTPGYVGADLVALLTRAASIAVNRKCSERIREYHANAERNITIVDLDDETDENVDNSNKIVPTELNEEKDKEDNLKENEMQKAADTVCETNSKQPKENDTAETQKAAAEEMEVDEAEKMADEVEKEGNDAVNISTEEPVEQTDEVVIDEKVDETEKEKGHANDNILDIPEPTLFELLNWLDNPPDDISFVEGFHITLNDFCNAVKVMQPSVKREGFITVPDVTWDDVGSLQDIREELKLAVLAPVKFPDMLLRLGLSAPSGVLLCGPPGCGKTLLAKAIANEAGINFISVKGPELMNMYVGESERAVRTCFQRARNSAPCVIFFDEFDSLCPKRSDTNEGGSGTRVVNQLLTELDGVEDRQGVYILAATNRPDIIDPAILRPGRLDTILYVGLPEEQDRVDILKATTKHGKRPVLADDVDFAKLASQTEGYTGADLAGLVRQAAMLALKEALTKPDEQLDDLCVSQQHFEQAIKMLRPSVTPQDRKIYEKLRAKYAAPRMPPVEDNGVLV